MNIVDKIKKILFPKKYEIIIDNSGFFKVVVLEHFDKAKEGKEVIIERVTELPKNMIRSSGSIIVIDENKNNIDVITTEQGIQWKFIMPAKNVTVIPTAKRKRTTI